MASSSSVGSMGTNGSRRQVVRDRCYCDIPVGKWISWTPANPGRRFVGCANYRDEEKDCRYFAWVDPPLPNKWYRDLIVDFHNDGNVIHLGMDGEVVEQQAAQEPGGGIVGGSLKVFFVVCWFVIFFALCK